MPLVEPNEPVYQMAYQKSKKTVRLDLGILSQQLRVLSNTRTFVRASGLPRSQFLRLTLDLMKKDKNLQIRIYTGFMRPEQAQDVHGTCMIFAIMGSACIHQVRVSACKIASSIQRNSGDMLKAPVLQQPTLPAWPYISLVFSTWAFIAKFSAR